MEGYLGSFEVENPEERTSSEWAVIWLERYGQIDGEHHKTWVIDQVARILKGTKVTTLERRWNNGHKEIEYTLDESSLEYKNWVDEMKGDFNEEYNEYEYTYDEGIAP